jgi:hypothetical protein
LQGLQNPSEINGVNLNNIKSEANNHFSNKKGKFLQDNINELVTNGKWKIIRDLYRGINDFKIGYQSRSNLVNDENDDLHADSHNILKAEKTTSLSY